MSIIPGRVCPRAEMTNTPFFTMIPLDPADYEPIKPARSGKPWPPVRCYYCGAPATYRETFASRDRESRCQTRGVCDACYQAAREGRHDGIIYKQRRRQRPPVEAAPSHRA